MENCKEYVTISLEKYEEMKSEIERLKTENAKKTIVKYYLNPIVANAIAIGIFLGLASVFYFITTH